MKKTQRRRRNEGRTDYKARVNLLKSGKLRLIIRKTNKYILLQVVETDIAQDKTLVKFSSKDLLTKGWPKELAGSLKSRQAAYLAGFALGKISKEKDVILDLGLNRNIKKSRLFSALKGAIDAGMKVPHNEEVLPTVEELESNEKLKDIFKKVKEAI